MKLTLDDALMAGLPEEPPEQGGLLPTSGLNTDVYTPQSEDDAGLALDNDPIGVMGTVAHAISQLKLAQTQASALGEKDAMAALNASLTAAYQLQAKLMALDVLGDIRQNYRRLPNDLKLDLLKLVSQHGGLVPKETVGQQGGGFQLNIIMSGQQPPPTVVVENQA